MKSPGLYDGGTQMFIDAPREADIDRLRFLRWLAERGKLEHEAAGPPAGPYGAATPDGAPGRP